MLEHKLCEGKKTCAQGEAHHWDEAIEDELKAKRVDGANPRGPIKLIQSKEDQRDLYSRQ